MATVQKLEDQRCKVFNTAHINIKKAQAQQTRSYNNHNCAGEPFQIGECVLKICKQAHCSKLKKFSVGLTP